MDLDERIEELLKKETLTSGRVAAACGVTMPTVHKWLERGIITGWRLPSIVPGQLGPRRILASSVVALIRAGQVKPKERVEATS